MSQAVYAFETGDSSWKRSALADNSRPDGFELDEALSDMNYMQGALAEGRSSAEHGARYAAEVKAPDAAGNLLATAALFEAQYGDCSQVTAIARKVLSYDASIQTLPGVADALAMCGQGSSELSALRKMATASPDNTLLNMVYLPEAEAAMALEQHRPQAVTELLESTHTYALASVAPIIEAEALLALHRPADALNILQPALKFRNYETQTGSNGQCPSYGVAMLLAARAQVMQGDKAGATKSYRQVIDLWKNADAGFKPLDDAKRELTALK